MTTIAEQAPLSMKMWKESRRNPLKDSTLRAYRSYLDTWIIPRLGQYDLSMVENGVMKQFTDILVSAGLAPASVSGITICLKKLMSSVTDSNGNQLYPRIWNADFIDAPRVVPEEQEAPVISPKALSLALQKASRQFRLFFALQAGSGLRMSEMLALRRGPEDGIRSFWDADKQIVYVRSAMSVKRVEQSPKSVAGTREVDICEQLNSFLIRHVDVRPGEYLFQTHKGTLLHVSQIYEKMAECGIPGTHSLRRFRCMRLEELNVPHALMDYYIGHSVGKAVMNRYTQLGKDMDVRLKWREKIGLGFNLPRNESEEVFGSIE